MSIVDNKSMSFVFSFLYSVIASVIPNSFTFYINTTKFVVLFSGEIYYNFIKFDISIAVLAASEPLLPAFVPALSIACSILSVVKTPKITGTWV